MQYEDIVFRCRNAVNSTGTVSYTHLDVYKRQEQPSNTSGNGSEQQSGSASDGDKTHDLTTIEGYLAQFGLTQDFLKTPSFTRFNGNRNLSTQQISGINVYQSAERRCV